MRQDPLHPAPVEEHRIDHREAHNREQLNVPSHLHVMWKTAVERLALDLQIEPIEAHWLLVDASGEVSKGLAWAWWA